VLTSWRLSSTSPTNTSSEVVDPYWGSRVLNRGPQLGNGPEKLDPVHVRAGLPERSSGLLTGGFSTERTEDRTNGSPDGELLD
jgi:hypothetical protein